jgi:type I restriction-modification system DNA methylase subunit
MTRRGADQLPPGIASLQAVEPHIAALVFLHEVISPADQAGWGRLGEQPDGELGSEVQQACRRVQDACPSQLDGFFDDCRFEEQEPSTLRRALAEVPRVLAKYKHNQQQQWTMLADIYERGRAASRIRAQGAYFTPWAVSELMVKMSQPTPDDWVLDPSCGGAVMLIAALEHVRRTHGRLLARSLTLFGIDIDHRTCQIARASLLLAGADPLQFHIACGDALNQPLLGYDRATGKLRHLEATCILGNPPFGSAAARSRVPDVAVRPFVVPDEVLYRRVPVAARSVQESGMVDQAWRRPSAQVLAA